MKKLFAGLLAVLLCLSLAACGDPNSDSPEAESKVSEQSEALSEDTQNVAESVLKWLDDEMTDAPENVLRCVYNDGCGNRVVIRKDDADTKSCGMIVSLDKLTGIKGSAAESGNEFVFDGTDPDGDPIKMLFSEGPEGFTLTVTSSTWKELPTEKVLTGFKPDIVEGF